MFNIKNKWKNKNKLIGKDFQNLSPLILLANWISLVMIVTRLAWIAQRLVSSKSPTK